MTSAVTATELRRQLTDLIRLELLGPKNGPDEECSEPHVFDRYLVGMLAPPDSPLGDDQDDALDSGESDRRDENGSVDQSTPRADSMFPSSMGLTFVVANDAKALRVEASWGQYLRSPSATEVTEAGNPKQVWKRHPRGGTVELPLAVGRIARTAPDPNQPGVVLQGLARRRPNGWIVTLFLVDQQTRPTSQPDEAWLFQVAMRVSSPDGAPILRHRDVVPVARDHDDRSKEDRQMAMLHRRDGEFASGHGTAVHFEVDPSDPWRATAVSTVPLPAYEVRQQTPRTAGDPGARGLEALVLDMKALADAPAERLPDMLAPLADCYAAWLAGLAEERRDPTAHLEAFGDEVEEALVRAKRAESRIREGLAVLANDPVANEAFRFANRAMALQRVRTQVAELRRRGDTRDPEAIAAALDGDPRNRSWYPFQLAFVLLNLASLADPKHADRRDVVDLLWFPTGGGKTEAYLGLTAFTMALRRLHGVVVGRVGDRGVAVLMRYTLRLLTVQQFQRAAALICACEVLRRSDTRRGAPRYGATPFRIGMWVGGRTSPNWTADAAEVIAGARDRRSGKGAGSPLQLTSCPWCGSGIELGRDLRAEKAPSGRGRTWTFCSDPIGNCPFSARQAPDEGVPVVVVDEEIYRLLPDVLVATVDKFAQLPWNGQTQMLFGQVDGLCSRHGFRTAETQDTDSHRREGQLPAAQSIEHPDLRPPDLIVQDELHLIAGPLGSLVGLYETAIDALGTWRLDGVDVRPKVIASTATVRNARSQVHNLFGRRTEVFPPPGTDASDNFFSLRRAPEERPGRLYLGVCAPGRRLKMALIRTYQAALAAAQVLYDLYGREADPWMTLVGYFNSLRELGGMRRLVDDDIQNHLWKMDQRGLGKRRLGTPEELTSRKDATEIPAILDRLEKPFDPKLEAERKEARKQGRFAGQAPIDVLLATNMVSVGVDVKRLGLMVVGGQPKTTAEYIQATSRVGRSHPGLVLTVYNWARPRDLSHYERFENYHATFYRHVESLSVTPFAHGAVERGLTALLVALIRQADATFNPNEAARAVQADHPVVKRAIETIAERAELVAGLPTGKIVRSYLKRRIDDWRREAARKPTLSYVHDGGHTLPLLHRPEEGRWHEFTCPNSLREVEPSAALLLDDEDSQ
jgi:hypothetical protein